MARRARKGDEFWAVVCRVPAGSPYPIVPGEHWGIEIDGDVTKRSASGIGFTHKEDAEAFRASLPTHYADTGREIPASDRELAYVRHVGSDAYVRDAVPPAA
jgi:hypothetical protein